MNTRAALGVVRKFDLVVCKHEPRARRENAGDVARETTHGARRQVIQQLRDHNCIVTVTGQSCGQGDLPGVGMGMPGDGVRRCLLPVCTTPTGVGAE